MEIAGEFRIPASKQAVWDALNNPEVLKDSLPGCENIDKTSDTEMTATVTIKLGPVKARFAGKVTLSDLNPPNSYTLTGEGQGGAAGFASGEAKVNLEEDGDGTILTYTAEAKVGGKLAQIGSRLIDSTSKKLAAQFFGKFAEIVGEAQDDKAGEPSAGEQKAPTAPAKPAAPSISSEKKRGGLPTIVWVGGVSIIAVILILLFTGVI
jgi:uncharacterized protein